MLLFALLSIAQVDRGGVDAYDILEVVTDVTDDGLHKLGINKTL